MLALDQPLSFNQQHGWATGRHAAPHSLSFGARHACGQRHGNVVLLAVPDVDNACGTAINDVQDDEQRGHVRCFALGFARPETSPLLAPIQSILAAIGR